MPVCSRASLLRVVKIFWRVQMYDGCCSVSKVTTKKVARKLRANCISGGGLI